MSRFKPIHGVLVVSVLLAGLLLIGSRSRTDRIRVGPDRSGNVVIDVADLAPLEVRSYHFLNPANQEVDFFVGRDESGVIQVAFDASESHFKLRRGFRFQNGWVVDNKCDSSFRLNTVNSGGGGCSPIPLAHRTIDRQVIITESDILTGWRLFR